MGISKEFGGVHIKDHEALSIARVTREVATNLHFENDVEKRDKNRAGQQAALEALTSVASKEEIPHGAMEAGQVQPASSDDYKVARDRVRELHGLVAGAPATSVRARPQEAGVDYLVQQHRATLNRELSQIQRERSGIIPPRTGAIVSALSGTIQLGLFIGFTESPHSASHWAAFTGVGTALSATGAVVNHLRDRRDYRAETQRMEAGIQSEISGLRRK